MFSWEAGEESDGIRGDKRRREEKGYRTQEGGRGERVQKLPTLILFYDRLFMHNKISAGPEVGVIDRGGWGGVGGMKETTIDVTNTKQEEVEGGAFTVETD